MNSKQSKNFSSFLMGFLAIVAVAFAILIWVGRAEQQKVNPVDNIAVPN